MKEKITVYIDSELVQEITRVINKLPYSVSKSAAYEWLLQKGVERVMQHIDFNTEKGEK